ncbi:MAG: GNAT family N-acetyltransferase [Treponema sp.]|nr:GNAT family N-acetyltransferase [Treponema sp.]
MKITEYANSLFEQPWWLDIVAPHSWNEILVKDDAENVIGRMPYVFDNKTVYIPKLTQNIGIWISPEFKNDYGKQKQIINEIFLQLEKYQKIEIALNPNNEYVLPFRWLGFSIVPSFTYRIEDLSNTELLYQNFNKTAKKNIKSANNKVTINNKTNINHLLDMLDKTFEVQKRKNPMDKELVKRIVETCDSNGNGFYSEAVDKEGNIHSCAYFVYDDQVCYYLLGATDSAFRSSGAQSLVIWDGIQFAATHSKIFDFEGSMVEGIENFFRQFGGKCIPYYRIRKGSFFDELYESLKPRIKKIMGYKI